MLECHGSNGDFLAAVAALSLLSIASRHHQYHSHNAVGFHNSEVLYRNTPAKPEQRLLVFGHGTRVSVRDLFGSMPVRVKQRPGQGDRPAVEKEWRRLLLHIVGLVLAWREPVTIRVREATSGLEIRLHPPQPRPGSTLSTTDSRDLVSRVSRGLSQAGLSDAADAGSWDRVSASGGGLSIKGCISLNPVASRRSQFICLGITPIPSELGARILYDEVNRVFSSSSFAALEDGAAGTELSQSQMSTTGGPASSQRPKRGVDRFPMFFLQVNATRKANPLHRSLDQLLAQTHRVDSVLQLLKTVCYDFLQKHHFSPRMPGRAVSLEGLRSHRGRDDASGSVSSRSGLSTATTRASKKPGALSRSAASGAPTAFGSWSRVKVGQVPPPRKAPLASSGSSSDKGPHESNVSGGSGDALPLLTRSGHFLRPPFADAVTPGQSRHFGSRSRTSSVSAQNDDPQPERGAWLDDLLKRWKNPIFEPTELPIPRSYHDNGLHGNKSSCRDSLGYGPSTTSLHSHVSKESLKSAKVISQVDNKFILARIPRRGPLSSSALHPSTTQSPSSSILLIIDQHAADERIRLEALARAYFSPSPSSPSGRPTPRTEPLPDPIRFEVSRAEGDLLRRFREHLASWGLVYAVTALPTRPDSRDDTQAQVSVLALPLGIFERCSQEPPLLIDLLRTEAWKLDERPPPSAPFPDLGASAPSDPGWWVPAFAACPRGILDLLNSRACRSKIFLSLFFFPPPKSSSRPQSIL